MDPVTINLITEVKRRPFLWDNHFENYATAESLELEWIIIAKIVGLTSEAVKYRWMELRDNFYRELRGVPLSGQNNSGRIFGSYDGRWAYFFKMTFLAGNALHQRKKESVKYTYTREAFHNRPEIIVGFPHKPFVEKFPATSIPTAKLTQPEIIVVDEPSPPKNPLPTEVKSEEQRHEQPKRKESLLPTSGKKKERKIEDDDMLYFKSLLSYLQHIPLGRRLHIRNKFQNILMEELSAIKKYDT